MNCSDKNAAIRRYNLRILLAMIFYIAFLVAAVWTFSHHHPTGLPAYGLAILPAIPVVGIVVIVGFYLTEEKDEFLRNLHVQSMIWSLGVTLTVTTVWGFLELFVPVAHLQLYLIFPLFWFLVGVSGWLLRMRYR
jgi:uncharacterized YccA/Bax inhibitor family protein